jgi:cell division septum initiation protein DivIVA
MLIGWVGMGAGGWYVLDQVEQETEQLKRTASKYKKETEEIKKEIDEEKLQASKDKVAQIQAAIDKLQAQRRTPAQVMHEMANVLTMGKLPDIDAEKQKQREHEDPRAKLNPNWDGKNVWIGSWKESGEGSLEIEGVARDASDISEYFKRVRASARFGNVSHATFKRDRGKNQGKGKDQPGKGQTSFDFKLSARVLYWD